MASRLRFEIRPSPASNDSEVRIIVDDQDWLGPDHLGLDPPELVAQLTNQESDRKVIVGRCECGAVGCDDVVVTFRREGETTLWNSLSFNTQHYDDVVSGLASDRSWENTSRRVERLVAEVFAGSSIDDGYIFDWASTRIRPDLVHLSFSKDGVQRLLDFSWDGSTEESALRRARQFHRERIQG